jgi:hypothetical protein
MGSRGRHAYTASKFKNIILEHYAVFTVAKLFFCENACYSDSFCASLGYLGQCSLMEHRTLKNVNNYLNTNIYSYLETSGGKRSNL